MVSDGKSFIDGKHDDFKTTLRKFAILGIACIEYLIANDLAAESKYKHDNIQLLKKLLD